MKRILTIMAAIVCLTACEKPINTSMIIGTWSECYDDPNFIMDGTVEYTFNEDGTYYSIEEGYECKSTYNYKDGMLTIGVGEEGSYKVIKLTTSTLVLERTQVYDGDKKIYKKTYNRVK